MTDKLTREQLKEDALMKQTARAADYMSQHTRLLIAGLVAIVVVAAGVYFVRANSHKAEDKGAAMVAEAAADYDRGNYEAAGRRLDDVLRNLGGTEAGRQAMILYGDIKFAEKNYPEAAEYYRKAVDKFGGDPIFSSAARQGLAASREELGQHAEAASLYRNLATGAPNDVIRSEMLYAAARNLLLAGNRDGAVELYEELGRNPSNSRLAQEARIRLAEVQRNPAGGE